MRLLAFLLLITSSAAAYDERYGPKDMASKLRPLVHTIPSQDVRNAFDVYLETIQPDAYYGTSVGGSNKGLVAGFSGSIKKNACLAKLAEQFYEPITKMPVPEGGLLYGRASLADDVSNYHHKKLEPGWLWNWALKISKGNANLAMYLIGICGHDDYNFGAFPFSCPTQASVFYYPKGLGADVDIPGLLKTRIAQVQAPTKGARALPAKHYHVYGAAYMACQLVRRGVSDSVAIRTEMLAANMYRGLRLCDDVSGRGQELAKLATVLRVFNDFHIPDLSLSEFLERVTNEPDFCETHRFLPIKERAQKLLCEKLKENYYYNRDSLVRNYPKYLYTSWYLGGQSVAGKQVPCTNLKLWGAADLLDPAHALETPLGEFSTSLYKPDFMSTDEYNEAKRKLATWLIDVRWTVQQHKVGAQFGAKVCRADRPQDLERAACAALKK